MVRDIAASTWDSTRQLNAAAEEAMSAIPTSARKTAPGLAVAEGMASAAPTAAVSITRATTRGLPSDQKSRTRGNSAAASAGVFTGLSGRKRGGWEWVGEGAEGGCELGDKQRRPRIMPQSRPKRQIKHGGGNSQKDLQGEKCEQKLSGAAISVFSRFSRQKLQ